MPSLIRLLTVLALLAALVYAGVWSLANLLDPQPRDMTITVPLERLGQ
jgi:hypothetical protein